MHPSVAKFLEMSQAELDEIYKGAIAGVVPDGNTRGTAIVGGSLLAKLYARVANLFFLARQGVRYFLSAGSGYPN